MTIIDVHQGGADWFQARCGLVTGSHCADILSYLKKGGEAKCRADYRAKLVSELLTGEVNMDGYLSPAMMWGSDQEKFARAAYEMRSGNDVDIVGFVTHPTLPRCGGSPDGLVGGEGIIEIKCPNTTTHINWMLAGVVPPEHEPQMSFYLAVTGRKWVDFVSFDPRLTARHRLFIRRMERNEDRIAEIEDAVVKFNAEVDATIAKLESINPEIAVEVPARVEDGTEITDADLDRFIPLAEGSHDADR